MTDPAPTDAVPPPPPRPFALPLPGIWVFLACLALAAFCNIGGLRGADYIGTDVELLRDNQLLNRLPGLQRIWFGAWSPSTYPLPQYAPLAQTTFYVERALGLDAPWAHRLVSVVLHAGVGLMVWQLARRLLARGAFLVTLLFVAHPMTVDSVSWLTERRNPVAALLGLASAFLLLRVGGTIPPPVGRWKPLPEDPARLYAIAAVLFVLGLFANASIAGLPLVVLLVVWWKRQRLDRRLVAACVALAIAGGGMLALASSIERARSGVATPRFWDRAPTDAGELAARVQVAGRAVAFYALKAAVPIAIPGISTSVAIDYPRWQTPRDVEQYRTYASETPELRPRRAQVGAGDVVAWLFPLAVVGAIAASWLLRARLGRGQFACVAGFALLLAPSLGFVDLGWMRYSFVANRAAYLALVPLLAGLVWACDRLLTRADDPTVTKATAAIAVGVLTIVSLTVSLRFRESASRFWLENVRVVNSARSWWPRYEFARSIRADPANLGDPTAYKLATRFAEEARRSRPDEAAILVLDGLLRHDGGDPVGAVRAFETSMRTFPSYGPAYFQAGESFREEAARRRTDPKPWIAALGLYVDAAARDPLDVRPRVRIGQTAFEIARRLRPDDPSIPTYIDQSATAFDEAVQLRPYDVDLLLTISRTLIDTGKLSDAGNLLLTARTIAPERSDVYVLSAQALAMAGNREAAEWLLRTALTLEPGNAEAAARLGELTSDAATRPATAPATMSTTAPATRP